MVKYSPLLLRFPSGKGHYLTVYPLSCPNTETLPWYWCVVANAQVNRLAQLKAFIFSLLYHLFAISSGTAKQVDTLRGVVLIPPTLYQDSEKK